MPDARDIRPLRHPPPQEMQDIWSHEGRMRHTCLTGNKCSCISNNRHGFRGEDDLDCRFAVGDRNTPEYSPAAKEGNLLFPENFTSIRRGFPDCPSLAEGDSSLAEGDRSIAEGDRIAAEGDRIANESSECRVPTGAGTRHQLSA